MSRRKTHNSTPDPDELERRRAELEEREQWRKARELRIIEETLSDPSITREARACCRKMKKILQATPLTKEQSRIKVQKMIEGLKQARCPLCKAPGQRKLCNCAAARKLSDRNHRGLGFKDGVWRMHGPIGKLP